MIDMVRLLAAFGVFLPWMSGDWLGGDSVTYSGFGFYTSYLGLTLKNPLVAASCSLTGSPEGARKLETDGFAAMVARSIFEEDLSRIGDAHLANLRAIRDAVAILEEIL